jgi:UDP-N-acetylglucosamine 2-epimerase (hydrolysing)
MQVKDHYEINFDDYGICAFHTVTSELDTISDQANSLFDALVSSGKNYVVILPNNDPGSEHIIGIIKNLNSSQFRTLPSMRFEYFSVLMKHASLIIGNSSAGVREAPFLGVPSINVGTRQHNRSQAKSVINADSFDQAALSASINAGWGASHTPSNEFGSGNASDEFVRVLSNPSFWELNLQKVFYDARGVT